MKLFYEEEEGYKIGEEPDGEKVKGLWFIIW